MDPNDCWKVLNIAPTSDLKQIKRAYASLLKQCRPEQDAEKYQQLREAYDLALAYQAPPSETSNEQASLPVDEAERKSEPVSPIPAQTELEPSSSVIAQPSPLVAIDEDFGRIPHDTFDSPNKHWNNVFAAHNRVFELNNQHSALKQLEQELNSEELAPIQARVQFEQLCIDTLIRQIPQTSFPYSVACAIANVFNWGREHRNDEQKHAINRIMTRIQILTQYIEYIRKQNHKDNSNINLRNIAQLLSGPFDEKHFNLRRFVGDWGGDEMKNLTQHFMPYVEAGLCPELDTPSFHWWYKHAQRCAFTSLHFWSGFLVSIMMTLFWKDSQPQFAADWQLVLIFILFQAISALLIWKTHQLFRFLSRKNYPTLQRYQAHPYFAPSMICLLWVSNIASQISSGITSAATGILSLITLFLLEKTIDATLAFASGFFYLLLISSLRPHDAPSWIWVLLGWVSLRITFFLVQRKSKSYQCSTFDILLRLFGITLVISMLFFFTYSILSGR